MLVTCGGASTVKVVIGEEGEVGAEFVLNGGALGSRSRMRAAGAIAGERTEGEQEEGGEGKLEFPGTSFHRADYRCASMEELRRVPAERCGLRR